jgi:Zn-dependent protease with chaperone function
MAAALIAHVLMAAHIGVTVLVAALTAYLVTLGARRLAMRPYDKAQPTHWTEVARLSMAVRRSLIGVRVGVAAFFALALACSPGIALVGWARVVGPAAVLAAAWMASGVAARGVPRVDPAPVVDGRPRWRGVLGALVAVFPLQLLVLVWALTLPAGPSVLGAVWVAFVVGSTWLVARGAGIRLGELLGVVHPAPPELQARIDQMAATLGLPAVQSRVFAMNQLNAFAMPNVGFIGVTDVLLARLGLEQTAAVCGHELGHLAEGPAVLRKRKAALWIGCVFFLTLYAVRCAGLNEYWQLGIAFVVLVAKMRFVGGFSPAAEREADRIAKTLESEPGLFALALEGLYRGNGVPAVLAGRALTHPHLYDRLVELGSQPDYPRPAPPPDKIFGRGALVAIVGVVAVALGMQTLAGRVRPVAEAGKGRAALAVLLDGPTSRGLSTLARSFYKAGDVVTAAELYAGAARLAPESHSVQLNAALALARSHRCADAEAALASAERVKPATAAARDSVEYNAEWAASVADMVATCAGGTEVIAH